MIAGHVLEHGKAIFHGHVDIQQHQHDGILFGFCLVHQGIGTVDGLFQRVRRTLQYRTDAQRKVQMGVAGEGGLFFTRNRFRLLCNNFLRGGVKWAKDCNKIKYLV